jgi:hypothetical protein
LFTFEGYTVKRTQYLIAVMRLLTVPEILLSARNPSAYMTRTHVMLHYVALRRLGVQA